MHKHVYVRNALVICGLIVLAYFFFMFISGRYIRDDDLYGTWVSTCRLSIITFTGMEYAYSGRSSHSGTFRIRGNRIIFIESGRSYFIRLTRTYLMIDGVHYIRKPLE